MVFATNQLTLGALLGDVIKPNRIIGRKSRWQERGVAEGP